MPDIPSTPVPDIGVDYADEIVQAMLTTLGSDPQTMVDGAQGIQTIEEWYPTDKAVRSYPKAALPAIFVRVGEKRIESFTTGQDEHLHEAYIGVVTYKAETRTAATECRRIAHYAVQAVLRDTFQKQTTWLSSGSEVSEAVDVTSGEPEQDEGNAHQMVSLSSMTIGVLHPDVVYTS